MRLGGENSRAPTPLYETLGIDIITQHSVGLPDVHSGYGFAIGNMAAFDTSDPQSVVSPGRSACE